MTKKSFNLLLLLNLLNSNCSQLQVQQPPVLPNPLPLPRPVAGLKPPSPLVIDSKYLTENWKLFKQKWRIYHTLTAPHLQNREYQVALLFHTLGDDALRIYNGMNFITPEQQRTEQEIIDAFETFSIGEVNEIYER